MIRTVLAGVSVLALSGCAHVWWQDAASDVVEQTPEVVVVDNPLPEPDPLVQIETKSLLPARIEQNSDVLFANAQFPEQLQIIAPKLDARLRAEAIADFEMYEQDAHVYKKADPEYFRPYGIGHTWTLNQHIGDLVSLVGTGYYNSGGAHPNHALFGVIYDRATDRDLHVLDLFNDRDAALEVLIPLVRAEILVQKQARYGDMMSEADLMVEVADGLPDSGHWLEQTALVASDDGTHFGGLEVYFSPYALGSYAEGSYQATVPQAAFRELLMPKYQALFSGTPVASGED